MIITVIDAFDSNVTVDLHVEDNPTAEDIDSAINDSDQEILNLTGDEVLEELDGQTEGTVCVEAVIVNNEQSDFEEWNPDAEIDELPDWLSEL